MTFRTETSRHQEQVIDFFVKKKKELNGTKKNVSAIFLQGSQTENLVLASYEISELIAETGYPHTVAEKCILPAMKILVSRWCENKLENQINLLPLSNDTEKQRIVHMAENLEETV